MRASRTAWQRNVSGSPPCAWLQRLLARTLRGQLRDATERGSGCRSSPRVCIVTRNSATVLDKQRTFVCDVPADRFIILPVCTCRVCPLAALCGRRRLLASTFVAPDAPPPQNKYDTRKRREATRKGSASRRAQITSHGEREEGSCALLTARSTVCPPCSCRCCAACAAPSRGPDGTPPPQRGKTDAAAPAELMAELVPGPVTEVRFQSFWRSAESPREGAEAAREVATSDGACRCTLTG